MSEWVYLIPQKKEVENMDVLLTFCSGIVTMKSPNLNPNIKSIVFVEILALDFIGIGPISTNSSGRYLSIANPKLTPIIAIFNK